MFFKFDIIDILNNPAMYIDESTDLQILSIPNNEEKGGILRFMVGVENGNYYIVVEDDYNTEDIYLTQGESLIEAFVRAISNNFE